MTMAMTVIMIMMKKERQIRTVNNINSLSFAKSL